MARKKTEIPQYDDMLVPTIDALKDLGGSGTIDEIYGRVVELMKLPTDVLDVPHGDSSTSEVAYRLAWSRTYLKKFGLLQNSARGVWSLTSGGATALKVDPKEIVRKVREQSKQPKEVEGEEQGSGLVGDFEREEELAWHQKYLEVLRSMSPAAFERLIQRMLRESGFKSVEVTGRTGDGGIDGFGLARVNGFLSFRVLFQCKRYQGSVSPSEIRDFRGAMQGRTEKGLYVTTGTFTREAIKEANRDGAPPIDLLNGEQLVQTLKDLGLGVRVSMVEAVDVDEEWFKHI
jgi:restriction system protein